MDKEKSERLHGCSTRYTELLWSAASCLYVRVLLFFLFAFFFRPFLSLGTISKSLVSEFSWVRGIELHLLVYVDLLLAYLCYLMHVATLIRGATLPCVSSATFSPLLPLKPSSPIELPVLPLSLLFSSAARIYAYVSVCLSLCMCRITRCIL